MVKHRKIPFMLLAALVVGLLGIMPFARPVLAEGEEAAAGYENVTLWLFPEYDDPRLLVMLEGRITGAEAPAEVTFLVPTMSVIYSAGSIDAQGVYSGGPPERAESEVPGWDRISYICDTDIFRVEYYDPIIIGTEDKTIDYEMVTPLPVSGLKVIVLKPLASSDFSVSPQGSAFTDDAGFTSFSYTYSGLDTGSSLPFSIAYTKTDPRPSLEIRDGGGTVSATLVIFIVVGALALGTAAWLWRRSTRTGKASHAPAAPIKGKLQKKAARKARFCGKCGSPVDPDHNFCPECGAKL